MPGPFTITCDHPAVPTDARNLVWRAAALLGALRSDHPAPPEGVHVLLEKRIPAEAGLGGGSSDAAATLVALSRIWDLSLDLPTLARIAARLGADVPFFLAGGTALGSGRGDDVSPLTEPPSSPVVIVNAAVRRVDAEAYALVRPRPPDAGRAARRCARCRHGRRGRTTCATTSSRRWPAASQRSAASGAT